MLRIVKNISLNLKNPLIRSKRSIFTSRPGDLNSKDDFWLLDNGVSIMETSLSTYNSTLFQKIRQASLPVWIRILLANRLSSSFEEWRTYFSLNNGGTHNN